MRKQSRAAIDHGLVRASSAPIYERPCTVTLADDGVVQVARPDGLTVVLSPAQPPIELAPDDEGER